MKVVKTTRKTTVNWYKGRNEDEMSPKDKPHQRLRYIINLRTMKTIVKEENYSQEVGRKLPREDLEMISQEIELCKELLKIHPSGSFLKEIFKIGRKWIFLYKSLDHQRSRTLTTKIRYFW